MPDRAFYENQQRLQEFSQWIRSRAGGYIGSVHRADELSVIVLWHEPRPVPREILDEAGRRGIRITIRRRQYDLDTLESAAISVLDESDRGIFAGFKIRSVATVDADFDGLIVGGSYAETLTRSREAADADLSRAATNEFGIAIEIESGMEPHWSSESSSK